MLILFSINKSLQSKNINYIFAQPSTENNQILFGILRVSSETKIYSKFFKRYKLGEIFPELKLGNQIPKSEYYFIDVTNEEQLESRTWYYFQAIYKHIDLGKIYYDLGKIHFFNKKYHAAIDFLKINLNVNGDNPRRTIIQGQTLRYLAKSYFKLGEYKIANSYSINDKCIIKDAEDYFIRSKVTVNLDKLDELPFEKIIELSKDASMFRSRIEKEVFDGLNDYQLSHPKSYVLESLIRFIESFFNEALCKYYILKRFSLLDKQTKNLLNENQNGEIEDFVLEVLDVFYFLSKRDFITEFLNYSDRLINLGSIHHKNLQNLLQKKDWSNIKIITNYWLAKSIILGVRIHKSSTLAFVNEFLLSRKLNSLYNVVVDLYNQYISQSEDRYLNDEKDNVFFELAEFQYQNGKYDECIVNIHKQFRHLNYDYILENISPNQVSLDEEESFAMLFPERLISIYNWIRLIYKAELKLGNHHISYYYLLAYENLLLYHEQNRMKLPNRLKQKASRLINTHRTKYSESSKNQIGKCFLTKALQQFKELEVLFSKILKIDLEVVLNNFSVRQTVIDQNSEIFQLIGFLFRDSWSYELFSPKIDEIIFHFELALSLGVKGLGKKIKSLGVFKNLLSDIKFNREAAEEKRKYEFDEPYPSSWKDILGEEGGASALWNLY